MDWGSISDEEGAWKIEAMSFLRFLMIALTSKAIGLSEVDDKGVSGTNGAETETGDCEGLASAESIV